MGHVNNILLSWEKMYVVGSLIDFFLGRLHKNAKNNSSTQNKTLHKKYFSIV